MKVAIDLDGTITAHPPTFIALSKALLASGHHVIILTAAAGEFHPDERPQVVRNRLFQIGMPYDEIRCCEQKDKPSVCKLLGINVLIDDTVFDMPDGTLHLHVR